MIDVFSGHLDRVSRLERDGAIAPVYKQFGACLMSSRDWVIWWRADKRESLRGQSNPARGEEGFDGGEGAVGHISSKVVQRIW